MRSWKNLGLTCFHCVDPLGKSDIQQHALFDRWARNGVRPDEPDAKNILVVDQPNLKDVDSEIKALGEDISMYTRQKRATLLLNQLSSSEPSLSSVRGAPMKTPRG
ncbi:hypothetical protein AJ80_01010 [Polytolypa hystricis UAMH7299]|uniref:Uncharacterized protein n=1 Tax=Polytolypa hystricis (strain UAMH7299) TaxID=1447883 RepID=A0A2B7Z1L8_POLH7|nr:hypothetical protein AJ80_01010 [Polytolypa hystricis UAMH7299]